jgi:hypothetical protein
MLHGLIEPPRFNLRNELMVRKHVHAAVLTMLHQLARASSGLEAAARQEIEDALGACLPSQIRHYLFDEAGHVRGTAFDLGPLGRVVSRHEARLLEHVERVFAQGWPAEDAHVVDREHLRRYVAEMPWRLGEVVARLARRLRWALEQMARLDEVRSRKGTLDPEEDAQRARCDRLVKKLKGIETRRRREAEGYDDTNTYGVLAAEGFLPGYGLDTGTVVGTHLAPRHGSDFRDWELRRGLALALREYVPGNLIYANGHRFLPRLFHLEAVEPLLFQVDTAAEAVMEVGTAREGTGLGLGATALAAVPICDVDLPHHSHISDEEDYRFQLPVVVYGHEQARHGEGRAYVWGPRTLTLRTSVHLRLVNVGAAQPVRMGQLGYPVCLVCGQSRSPLASEADRDLFTKEHHERHGRPVEPVKKVGFFADVVADALCLQGCVDREEGYSVMETLRKGAAEVLEMELEDLQLLVIARPGETAVDLLLYDPMPGGSGLLAELVARFGEVVAAARAVVEDCPASCVRACIDCLWNFRNAYYHRHLDRRLAAERLGVWGDRLEYTHAIPARLPASRPEAQPVNQAEATLGRMLERAGLHGAIPQHAIDLGRGWGVTVPDFYFADPSGDREGLCIYLDGMSSENHGDPARQRRDREVREVLRNRDYEVFEIPFGDLTDREAMTRHFFRIARRLVGRERAESLRDAPSWFDAPAPEPPGPGAPSGPWDESLMLLAEVWHPLARGLESEEIPPPEDVHTDLFVAGRVSGGPVVMMWRSGDRVLALVEEARRESPGIVLVVVSPESPADEIAAAIRAWIEEAR